MDNNIVDCPCKLTRETTAKSCPLCWTNLSVPSSLPLTVNSQGLSLSNNASRAASLTTDSSTKELRKLPLTSSCCS